MELSLWSLFVVNIALNSFLSFFTLSLLIFLFLRLLRIKNPRLKACCLVIPFVKLALDLGSYQFSDWALAQHLNPLTSPEGTRTFHLSCLLPPSFHFPFCSIAFYLSQGETFTLADLICLKIGATWTTGCAIGIIGGTVWFLGCAVRHYFFSHQWLKNMCTFSTLYPYPLQDQELHARIQRQGVCLYLSEAFYAPCIVSQFRPMIFLPRSLVDQLAPEEFEAIIAHEMAHLEQGDLLINAYLFWISHFFWWIPMQKCKRKLELFQEYACDRLIGTNLPRLHLAEALYKAAHWSKTASVPSLAQPFATSHHALKRLHVLLTPTPTESSLVKGIKILVLMSAMIILVFGKFWTF